MKKIVKPYVDCETKRVFGVMLNFKVLEALEADAKNNLSGVVVGRGG